MRADIRNVCFFFWHIQVDFHRKLLENSQCLVREHNHKLIGSHTKNFGIFLLMMKFTLLTGTYAKAQKHPFYRTE